MIVLPTFAGLKATYNVLDLKITKKKKREVERKYIQKTTWCCCCLSHLSCKHCVVHHCHCQSQLPCHAPPSAKP